MYLKALVDFKSEIMKYFDSRLYCLSQREWQHPWPEISSWWQAVRQDHLSYTGDVALSPASGTVLPGRGPGSHHQPGARLGLQGGAGGGRVVT